MGDPDGGLGTGAGRLRLGGRGAATPAPSSAAAEVRTVEHAMGTAEVTGTPGHVVVLDTGELDAGPVLDDLERFAEQLGS